ncbi:SWI/SNF chromatin-remodeling complex subunit snf5, partial [Neolecta irregularis DAH-3]
PSACRARAHGSSRRDLAAHALLDERLVPVRLELDSDKHKLRDTFTWNSEEKLIKPEYFAHVYCADHAIPAAVFAAQIAKSLAEQLADFHPHHYDPRTVAPQPAARPWSVYKDDDLRITIKLDITIGNYNLLDAFEWDINCPANIPELFAAQLAADLCLCGEFVTAIAHQIREQCQQYTKTLVLLDHKPGDPIQDDEVRQNIVPTLTSTLRTDTWNYTPTVSKLSPEEIEKQDQVRDRETRRKRRQLRAGRRGVALPDFNEIFKTHRTPCHHSVLPPGEIPLLKHTTEDDDDEDEDIEDVSDDDDDDILPRQHIPGVSPVFTHSRLSKIVKLKLPKPKVPSFHPMLQRQQQQYRPYQFPQNYPFRPHHNVEPYYPPYRPPY